MKQRLRGLLAMMVLVIGLCLVVVTPAAAVGCSGTGCNGQDPEVMGCAADAFTMASAPIHDAYNNTNVGTVDIRYSPTCKTNWGRATMSLYTENVATWTVGVVLQDGSHLEFTLAARLHPGSVNWCDMLYAPVQPAYAWSSLVWTDAATGVKRMPEGRTVWAA